MLFKVCFRLVIVLGLLLLVDSEISVEMESVYFILLCIVNSLEVSIFILWLISNKRL